MCAALTETLHSAPGREDWYGLAAARFEEAGRCHGALGLTLPLFRDKLLVTSEKCMPPSASWGDRIDFLSRQHTSDLYLAAACAATSEVAWQRFATLYRKYLNDLLRYLCSLRNIAVDLADSIIIDLFLPDRSGRSRISSYDGRSSLATWLRVILSNRVVNEGNRKCNSACRTDLSAEVIDVNALQQLDAALKIDRYGELIDQSLRSACDFLSPKERLMLLWRFEEGLQLSEIAEFLGVHQSTVTRGLERIAQRLHQQVVAILSKTYLLNDAAIEECLSVLMESSPHSVSLLTLLRESASRVDFDLEAKMRKGPPGAST
jgi:RNA polymerase sigma-70 factor